MTALSAVLEAVPTVSALVSHVWQSTLFVAACWLAVVLLRHNRASIRYSIWLVASVKFLFPFSILIGVGAYAGAFTDIQAVPGQGFVRSTVGPILNLVEPPVSQVVAPPLAPTTESALLEQILVAGWLFGAAIVAVGFVVRWRRLSARIGNATLLTEGREMNALRRVQSRFGWAKRVRLAMSASSIEPGVRGIVRPVLLLPAGITDRLTEAQLDTILAHELCHLRRRDNLASVFHLIVQTIFWFHPIVWWIGSRLVEERERSCDEYVLKMGSDPEVYASAILRVCEELCLPEPFAAVSRVTGANLTRRIEDIMTKRIVARMGSGRRFLLASAAVAFVVTPVLLGMTTVPPAMTQRPVERVSVPIQPPTVALRPVGVPANSTLSAQVRPPAPQTTPAERNTPVENTLVRSAPRGDYLVRTGDELEVFVWREPELRGRSLVRPDGKIGLPLVGDVQAEGLKPRQVQDNIQDRLSSFISNPQVTVIVATVRKPQVTIQGAIHRPGAYAIEGRLTVLQLLALAGGLSEFAKRGQIAVFREEGTGVRRYVFDYDAYLAGTNLDQNIALKEDDIIMVP
jgi:protein involved in polysaccharide export with SLBB domain/beta-lactamase regulating signal transducer with metallopeptidase domain